MTAFLSFLGHLTVVDWLFIVTAWVIVAAALLRANHRAHSKPDPEPVVRAQYPPPVPASITPPLSQTVPSADWFRDIPSDCLGDDAVRALCDDIEKREFS